MTKNYFNLIGFFLSIVLIMQSCRNESLALEQENSSQYNYNIAVLDREQLESKINLLQEVNKIKNNFFQTTNSKTPKDRILEGAIIETNNVLEITKGSDVTYTFPIARTFSNDIVENLVLRENADHTYSGALIQYRLSSQEKDRYLKGEYVDLKGKIKTYIINNISISGKGSTYSYYDGCWEFVYETNPCAGTEHHSYGASCPLAGTSGAAQPNQIIAAYNHCGEGDSGGGSGSGSGGGSGTGSGTGNSGGSTPGSGGGLGGGGNSGGGDPGGSGTGGNTYFPDSNPYNTFLFASFDDMYNVCAEGDEICEADRQLNVQVQQYLLTLSPKTSTLASYTPILRMIKDYFLINGYGDGTLTERLNLLGNWFKLQNNTDADVKLNNFKFASWSLKYFIDHDQEIFDYFKNHPDDLNILFMDDVSIAEDAEFANESANVVTDILINNQNASLNNLNISWPNLDTFKQKVKQAISYGVYTTAKYTRNYLYLPMYKLGVKYPATISWSNKAIDKIRLEAVTPMVNFNVNSMGWGDLFNIWLFELTPGNYANDTINFTNASNIVNGNSIYNPSTNAVKNFPKGNWIDPITNQTTTTTFIDKLKDGLQSNQYNVGSVINGYFNYNVNAFYSTLSNANIGIQMLGSFPVKGTILTKSTTTAVVQFYVYNYLGWESGTRFIKGTTGNGNQGVINDKPVGSGLHLGGTIRNNFTWTETINF